MDPSLWLPKADRRPTARLRLLCFAHAGGGSTPFVRWGAAMPEGVTVCPVRRPGRESALSQPLLRDTRSIVAGTMRALQTLPPCPTALYGHSFGALVAFEVAAAMQAAGATPELLIVSAKPAPHIPWPRLDLAHLPDEQFIRELDRRYGGIPSEVKAIPELLELMLPALRADIAASESYRHTPGPLLRCPIVACGGRDDRAVEPARVRLWGELTESEFTAIEFAGGHFFSYDPASGFLGMVRERLTRWLGG